MKGVKLIRPSITSARIGGQEVGSLVMSVDMQAQLGGQTSCSVELTSAQAAEQATVQGLDEMLSNLGVRAGGWQAYLDGRDVSSGPDFHVGVDTGLGSLKFSGWVAQAQAGVGLSGANHTVQAVGVDQLVEAIDPSVYEPVRYYRQDFFKAETESLGSLGRALSKALGEWQSHPITDGDKILSEYTKAVAEQSLAINQAALPHLDTLLGRTESPFLDEIIAGTSTELWPNPRDFLAFLFNLLSTQGQSSVLQAVRSLAQAFGGQYVPNLAGAGKIVDNQTLLERDPLVKEVEARELHTRSNRPSMTQINRVTAEAQVVEIHRSPDGGEEKESTTQVIGAYPRESQGQGVTQPIPPPPWTKVPSSLTALKLEEGGDEANFDLEKVKPALEAVEKQAVTLQDLARKVMDWWAKQAYLWLRLRETGASLPSLPLDPVYEVGQRLELTTNSGKTIGTGLINSVGHRLVLHENQIQAQTSVSLSHMEYSGDD